MKTIFSILLVISAASPALGTDIPLPLELPKPLFVGTPTPIQVPNLEKPRSSKRPDFLAPPDTINVARGKTVSGSDTYPVIGELDFVTDGDKTGSDGSFVEFGPGPQWVQIDLGTSHTIHAIVIWHFHAQPRAYHDVVVQVAEDPDFKKGVITLFNNDDDNSLSFGAGKDRAYIETYEGKLIDARGIKSRYVRLYSNGNTTDELNHYVEVEVFGRK